MKRREYLQGVMLLAWQFIHQDGLTRSKAMKLSWYNFRLRGMMKQGVVCFRFTKMDGSVREAFGTLKSELMPALKNSGKKTANDEVQRFFDTTCGEFRSFRKANLLTIA